MTHRSPFHLLGQPERFDIDPRALRAGWLRSLAVLHPDADGSASDAAALNEAYRLLSDPLERAQALLAARGAPPADGRRMPDGLLAEMMDLREQADAAHGDAAAVSELRTLAGERRATAIADIAKIFASAGEGAPIDARTAQAVTDMLHVARAFDRMLEQLDRESGAEAP